MPDAGKRRTGERSAAPPRAVTLIAVPYHLGREGAGMALGPDAYLDGGLADMLEARGFDVDTRRVTRGVPFTDTASAVAESVRPMGLSTPAAADRLA